MPCISCLFYRTPCSEVKPSIRVLRPLWVACLYLQASPGRSASVEWSSPAAQPLSAVNEQATRTDSEYVFLLDQESSGDKLRITVREFDASEPDKADKLSKGILHTVSSKFPDGTWLDWPIVNPKTMELVFAQGKSGSTMNHATTLMKTPLARTAAVLPEASSPLPVAAKPLEPLLQASSFAKLGAGAQPSTAIGKIDWAKADRTEHQAAVSDDGSAYIVVFSLHSGLPEELQSAADLSRLAWVDAKTGEFWPLTLEDGRFNELCPSFLPGSSKQVVFLSTGRQGCEGPEMCLYSLDVTCDAAGCRGANIHRLIDDSVFEAECPRFGSLGSAEDGADHYLLLARSVAKDQSAIGYSAFDGSSFSEFQLLFQVPLVDLPAVLQTRKFFDCLPSPWNTSGTIWGDLLCDTASQHLELVDVSGKALQQLTKGNYGEAKQLRTNRHATFFRWVQPGDIPPIVPSSSAAPTIDHDEDDDLPLAVVALLSIVGVAIVAISAASAWKMMYRPVVVSIGSLRSEVELQHQGSAPYSRSSARSSIRSGRSAGRLSVGA
eukprot:TRINITY_DN83320_c0_g1_i1.p1 TRINITY_DN83320_c0_g1~~TRINITY_DN83320_c0_g1_i1.p1  ORF type:complete len:568 (-),score=98.65 TRINITY_DN83320_c0_g1_i1:435-2081(-)